MSASVVPYGHQSISAADIEAVVAVLRSDWLTQGPGVPAFEAAVTRACGAAHAVAVNSATSALHIACLALDVGPGDAVWTTPNTFAASANCARYCGADVDFVDIDAASWNLSPDALRDKLEHTARAGGRLPRVLIVVHFAGQPCDMAALATLSAQYGFAIIEDASHALGGSYHGVPVGACSHSSIAVFSFHPVKSITTGEGGMAVTNDADLARRMRSLRSHGFSVDDAATAQSPPGPRFNRQVALGYNYRMTDIGAALGISQLARLQEFVARRESLAQRYDAAFADVPLRRQASLQGAVSARHLYVIRVDEAQRTPLWESLRDQGIAAAVHYPAVHLHPYYRDLGFSDRLFPNAEAHGREALSLPLFPDLRDEDQSRVIDACRSWFTK